MDHVLVLCGFVAYLIYASVYGHVSCSHNVRGDMMIAHFILNDIKDTWKNHPLRTNVAYLVCWFLLFGWHIYLFESFIIWAFPKRR